MPFHERRPSWIAEDAALGSADTLRRARRLRHRLRHDPARLHACLRNLCSKSATPAAATRALAPRLAAPFLQADPIVVSAFTDQVTQALDGYVLRYSNRLALLASAAKLGISRFEANLIIATVQYRHNTPPPPPTTGSFWLMLIAFVITVQAAIVLAVWRLFGV
ncbi:MAG: hypothetical protein NTU53_19780 [Planctomycetota bacterium]|nr:hypothetical protein [Planctomycetota bacterium]